MNSAKINVNKILTIFLFSHFAIWVLIPSISNDNLPLDTIEALAWGSNLDWGFNKHPPLSAFAVEIFYQIFRSQDWAYYFLSQIFVVTSFFVVWKFSEDFLKKKIHSLISVLLLEGIYFYNYTTPEFNVYVCELPFWALTVLFCWKGFKDNKTSDWLLFGLFAALATGGNLIALPEGFVGLNETAGMDLSIYPNPSKGTLFINGLHNGRVIITNLSGKVVKEVNNTGDRIDIRDLSKGFYQVSIEQEGQVFNVKLIKE